MANETDLKCPLCRTALTRLTRFRLRDAPETSSLSVFLRCSTCGYEEEAPPLQGDLLSSIEEEKKEET